MKPVKSSAIEAAGYDAASRQLHVTYKGGTSHVFHDVAPELAAQLHTAESPGRLMNEIKAKHRSSKREEPSR